MNRAQIRSLVIDHTGRSDKVTLIDSMITAALKKVSAEKNWRDLLTESSVTMTVGGETALLDTAMVRMIEARIIDGLSSYKLDIRTKSWLVQRWPDFSSLASSKPRYAYIEGNFLHLLPPPDEALTLKYSYYKRVTDLTDDTTELSIAILDEAIIAYATFRTFKSLQMYEDANQWFADYQTAIKDAKNMDRHGAVEQKGTPRGEGRPVQENYYLNPFIKGSPNG